MTHMSHGLNGLLQTPKKLSLLVANFDAEQLKFDSHNQKHPNILYFVDISTQIQTISHESEIRVDMVSAVL